MKLIVVALISGKEELFKADEWAVHSDGFLYLKQGANSVVAVIAAGQWLWVADNSALTKPQGHVQ
jgi:hypothetical protein